MRKRLRGLAERETFFKDVAREVWEKRHFRDTEYRKRESLDLATRELLVTLGERVSILWLRKKLDYNGFKKYRQLFQEVGLQKRRIKRSWKVKETEGLNMVDHIYF